MSMATAIVIQVNGERRETAPGTTVAALLSQLDLTAGRVAIERNLRILPKTEWEKTELTDGDRFEIVQFVGGG
jgi:thiamine biosynthesis protein ThiS